jgi:hypothetical protein
VWTERERILGPKYLRTKDERDKCFSMIGSERGFVAFRNEREGWRLRFKGY